MNLGTRIQLLALLILALPLWSMAAVDAPLQLKITRPATVSGQQNQVRVIVTAKDHDGHAIKGLVSEQFGLEVDDVTANISKVERTTSNDQPLAVVLALDISGSMAKDHAFDAARNAALAFIGRLGSADRVSLTTFGDSAKQLTDFTSDGAEIRQVFGALKAADQRTLLYEGIFKAAEEAAQASTGKVVVIVLTDGKDEGSSITLEDATGKALASAVPVYTLGFGPQADEKTLRRISELTGAEYRYAPTVAELPALYGAIWEQLKDAYAIEGETQVLHPGSHKINVMLNYRDQQLMDTTNVTIPRPPLPRWVVVTAGAVAGLALLLASIGWAVTRQTRSKKVVEIAPASSLVWVDVLEGAQRKRRIRMLGKSIRIGRATECQLRGDDPAMGAHHAEIVMEGSAVSLTDDGSEFPTLLNGNRLRPNQSVRLRDGDRVTTGATVFVFCDQRQGSSQTTRDPTAIATRR